MTPGPWKLLSVLLQYPEDELGLEASEGKNAKLATFLAWRSETPLAEQQQAYVRTFDFDRRASLYLTYHTHGDRRQRGLELVRLKRRFAEAGLPLTGNELPDYLPVLLEFTALAPREGEALLNELRPSLELVRSRLHDTGSPYAPLVDVVVGALPRPTKEQLATARRIASEGPPAELVGLEPFPTAVPS
ncbi:MAG TPA: nitrate reductase molybdenum cofactor assembly chaperone [Gaiellaceae bacterium]|nr:nitrate reductase molybdenum cofactor assembly chaperone [Gaiellaceae bacterium]